MNRLVLLCGALLLFAGIASAQDEAPKVEAFGGYSYVHVSANGMTANFNGGSGSFAYNLTPMFGVVGDVGGYHWSQRAISANVISYLFGPKVALRHGPITPFAQALFGGAHISATNCGSGCASASENAFAMTVGGGVDWNATQHIGIRLVQAEYLLTEFSALSTGHQNSARISTGVVFRW